MSQRLNELQSKIFISQTPTLKLIEIVNTISFGKKFVVTTAKVVKMTFKCNPGTSIYITDKDSNQKHAPWLTMTTSFLYQDAQIMVRE